jgi:hypothetical protein
MRQSEPQIDILPSPGEIARMPVERAELDRLVQQKVAEILSARDQFVFEPFFRSRQIAYELKRLQTVPEQRKWTVYFARFGCLLCETQQRNHTGNGMCNRCYANTFQRLKQILGETIKQETPRPVRGLLLRAERSVPETAPRDGIHHTLLKRSSPKELLLYSRVAKQLNLTARYVRDVAVGLRHSEPISAALKKEREKMRNAGGDK